MVIWRAENTRCKRSVTPCEVVSGLRATFSGPVISGMEIYLSKRRRTPWVHVSDALIGRRGAGRPMSDALGSRPAPGPGSLVGTLKTCRGSCVAADWYQRSRLRGTECGDVVKL